MELPKNITAEEVEAAIKAGGYQRILVRSCSMCGAPLHYVFDEEGQVYFDANCYCVTYRTPPNPATFEDLASWYNIQDKDEHKKAILEKFNMTEGSKNE